MIASLVTTINSCTVSKSYRDQHRFGNSQNTGRLSASDIEVFLSKIKPTNNFIETQYKTARFLQQRNKHRAAIEVLQEILNIDPRNVKAYNAVGISYDSLSDFDRAEMAYQAALKLQPDLDYVHNNLGFSYVLQAKYDLAISAFQRAIYLKNKKKQYRYNLALAYAKKGEFDAALSQFQMTGDETNACGELQKIIGTHKKICEVDSWQTTSIQSTTNGETSTPALQDTESPQTMKKIDDDINLVATSNMAFENNRSEKLHLPAIDDTRQRAQKNVLYVASGDETLQLVEEQNTNPLKGIYQKPKYALQVGAFHNKNNALKMREKLSIKGRKLIISEFKDLVSKDIYKVRVCCFDQKKEVLEIRDELFESEQIDGFITLEKSSPKPLLESLKPVLASSAEKSVKNIDVEVEVSNGNGVNRMARRLRYYLKNKGVKVTRLTNADHFRHQESKIFYSHGYEAEAKRVEKYLPGRQQLRKTSSLDRSFVKLKIVIGKDIIHFDRQLKATYLKPTPIIAKSS
jgi:tetratricopeptide (TPR) repeat protein